MLKNNGLLLQLFVKRGVSFTKTAFRRKVREVVVDNVRRSFSPNGARLLINYL